MNVVGIRFREVGKIYYYKSEGLEYFYKDKVVVESDSGLVIGEVALENLEIDEEKFQKKIKPVLRLADACDLEKELTNTEDATKAIDTCQQLADMHNLNMKVVDAEYTLDRNKLTFYFISDKRVDFRELVKDLAQSFKSRIELRQIGVRDHAKLIKHYGSCGQQCCCSRHLTDFAPLSIKYAKDQNISLDPSKISGVCGRLMCCLSYEEDYYVEAKKTMPKYGQKVQTEDGEGMVISSDFVKSCCKVRLAHSQDEEKIEKIFKVDQINKIDS